MERTLENGFTIVEILVVAAILSLLVALMIPVITNAREYSYLVYCQSELRVLGQAYHAYANDYNDGIAISTIRNKKWVDIFGYSTNWYGLLKPYGKQILDDSTYADRRKDWISCPKYKPKYNSYGQNINVGFYAYKYCTIYPTKFSQVKDPATTVLMSENSNLGLWAGWANKVGKKGGYPTPHFGKYNSSDGWHHGSTNALLVDGHVEEVKWDNHHFETENLKPPYHQTWNP